MTPADFVAYVRDLALQVGGDPHKSCWAAITSGRLSGGGAGRRYGHAEVARHDPRLRERRFHQAAPRLFHPHGR
jgi:hypothetical protein